MCYGILRDSLFPVAATQGFGQLAAIVFNVIYFKWSPPQARKDNVKLYVIGIVIYCIVTLYFVLVLAGVTGQTNYDGSILMGYAGVAINLCLFVSPLTTLKRVVETKSAASIPINLSIMMFASSVLWVITGLLDSDYFITSLNLAGVAFGASQMVLYHIYHPGRGVNALPDQQYGANGELPVVVSPTSKDAGVVVTIESPAYKPIASPALGKTV
ncbi:MtN3-like protein [Phytophthora cinnamomi]|uniref:MtN3-like protein n=1 Tax=Phytophthora cinnamomi TaxID=4785 RepID=UPI003559FF9C|nr:MtN3-like protein [Phytophthora cinnamomi]